jgi:hypothetical protein
MVCFENVLYMFSSIFGLRYSAICIIFELTVVEVAYILGIDSNIAPMKTIPVLINGASFISCRIMSRNLPC